MSRTNRAIASAFLRVRQRTTFAVLILLLAASATGCVKTSNATFVAPDPSDSEARVPAPRYRSAIAPYTTRRPVDPAPWREQNERVAPAPKQ